MTLTQLFEKRDALPSMIAERIDMPRGTFNNKLKGNNGAKFTTAEFVRIVLAIQQMNGDFTEFLKGPKL